jgi:hypothetical protein
MYLTEDMELSEMLVARGSRPLGRPGGKGGQGAGARQKVKNKLMDSGVSHQVKLGSENKLPCSAAHLLTLLYHDLFQRS